MKTKILLVSIPIEELFANKYKSGEYGSNIEYFIRRSISEQYIEINSVSEPVIDENHFHFTITYFKVHP